MAQQPGFRKVWKVLLCQSARCPASDISLLSRCFYPSFLQNPGTLLHPSDCPKTQAPLQQIIGPLAHEGFYGVEGHLKPELEQTLNNEHLISI